VRWVALLVCHALFPSVFATPGVFAAEATIDRPNQYPSPTVKQPATADKFDTDYPWYENTLTGDWGGLRGELAQNGVVSNIRYVSLLLDNWQGGFDTGFFGAGPLGITTTFDTERLIGLEGGTLFFDYEFNHWLNGRFPPSGQFDPTGSYVGVNTNLIDSDTTMLNQVAQLYYKQLLCDDDVTFIFGKMDANVPFATVGAAAPFQSSSAMYTPTLNPFIPTYPNEATGLVLKANLTDSFVGKFGWFDGTTASYDPATGTSGPATGPRGPETFFHNDGNWLLMTQWELSWQLDATRPGSAGVGAWVQTGLTGTAGSDTDGVSDVPGWYVQWQQTVWSPSAAISADNGGVKYFGQFGWSDPNKNPVHWSIMTGVSATGVFACRPADAVGILYTRAEFTDNPGIYQSTQRNGQPGPSGGSEGAVEAFYLWQWTSWSYLQPGIMWIDTPGGGSPAPLDDALLGYLLVGVEF
jgi:porin